MNRQETKELIIEVLEEYGLVKAPIVNDIALSLADEKALLLKRISKALYDLGMPTHIKGYHYARTSISMVFNNPELLGSFVKGVYGGVAGQYRTTGSRVERAIRHAIEVAWVRGNPTYINKLFGYTVSYNKAKPTASEFISKLADELKLGNI